MEQPRDYAEPERRVILVHGINTDGRENTVVMAEALEARGLVVVPFRYHPVRFWNARLRAMSIARSVMNYARSGDAAVAHSFGCLVLYRAMEMGAQFSNVVYFGAAMERKVRFPHDGVRRLLNVTNPYDRALSVGRLLPWHPFGLFGRDGYGGEPDSRIIEEQSTAKVGPNNHTAPYFSADYLGYWADRVHEFVTTGH